MPSSSPSKALGSNGSLTPPRDGPSDFVFGSLLSGLTISSSPFNGENGYFPEPMLASFLMACVIVPHAAYIAYFDNSFVID